MQFEHFLEGLRDHLADALYSYSSGEFHKRQSEQDEADQCRPSH